MKKRDENAVVALVVATGISSVAGQLALIREFLAQFQGNEFVIALILFNWLVLGAAGTLLAQVSAGRGMRAGSRGLAVISLLLVILPPALVIIIRELRAGLFVQGASVGFAVTLAFTFLTLLPYCLLVGFVLPYALFVLRSAISGYPGARIYIFDNLGNICGGLLFTILLVFALRPMRALFAANLPLLAAVLFYASGRQRRKLLYGGGLLALVLLAAGMGAEGVFLRHMPGRLVDWRETRYGRLTVYRQNEQVTLFEDGRPLSGSQQVSLAEELIHYPLAQLDRPRRLLLIAAPGGAMAQIAKYHLKRIDYVEINPALSDVQLKFGLIRKIAGLHIIHADGRAFLKHTRRRYDAVIVCLGEPSTYRLNRYFTRRFFRQVRRHLSAGGIFSFSMPGYENYLSELKRRELSVLYSTAHGIFSHLLLLPGQKIVFLCRNGPLRADIPALLRQRKIATDYIRRYFYGNLTAQRIAELNRLVASDVPPNTDYAPRLMQLVFSRWFAKFSTSPAIFFVPAAMLMAAYLWLISGCEFVLLTSGWFDMGSEILVIFAFQIIFGYIYFQIALIVTVFLAGLLPGAWVALRRQRAARGLLVAGDGLLVLLALLFAICLKYAGDMLAPGFFLVFGFAVSLVCGYQFPIALQLKGDRANALTRIFAADLVGAAAGTIVTSVVLIPYVGLLWSAAFLAGVKLLSMIVTVFSHAET